MYRVELLVKLKIPDVTALTAAGALRRRMGYGDVLKGLKRADYYRLDLAAPSTDAAESLAARIAETTNLFVNPNKHVYEVRSSAGGEAPSAEGVYLVQVLVTDPTDGSAQGALGALQGRLGYEGKVSGLLKGVLWTLELEADSAGAARGMAEQIAVTKSREEGLLMNPHFQECIIL